MNHLLEDVVKVMTLERLELDLFRGESRDIGSPQVFGGQVLGQALMAAAATVVDRARDGNHFSTRRIVAIQHGAQIFNMSASFQAEEPGLAHQVEMPAVPPPEGLRDLDAYYGAILPSLPPAWRLLLEKKRPFEFRPTQPPTTGQPMPPLRNIWFRANDALPDDDTLHRCLLAYVSDFHLLDTALLSHGLLTTLPKLQMASIDHAMWFHRSMRVDDCCIPRTAPVRRERADSRAATSSPGTAGWWPALARKG